MSARARLTAMAAGFVVIAAVAVASVFIADAAQDEIPDIPEATAVPTTQAKEPSPREVFDVALHVYRACAVAKGFEVVGEFAGDGQRPMRF